jgi:hypothetical protein
MSEITVAMTTEIEPPPEGKKSRKPRKKTTAGPSTRARNGAPRPYRSLQADVLAGRITKLTTRLDKEALEATQPAPPGPPALQNDIELPA